MQNEMYKKYGQVLKKQIDDTERDYEITKLIKMVANKPVIDLINKCKGDKKKIYICSSNDSANLKIFISQLGLEDYFQIIMGRDVVDFVKPDPDGFYKYFHNLSENKDDFLMIGDRDKDREAATNAKIDYIDVSELVA